MSRITKEIAHATAVSLLSKKKDKLEGLKKQLQDKVTEAVRKTIPADVLEVFSEHPCYFKVNSQTRLVGSGFGYDYFSLNQTLPKTDAHNPKIEEKEASKIVALHNKIEEAEKEYKRLRTEIEVALFAFRTYANVEKEFPEAFALLPTKVSQAVMVNISSIRSQIAN